MDKYYSRAQQYIKKRETEEALTILVTGLELGHPKCAYGIVHTVVNFGSYTMSEDEAVSIFRSNYAQIKCLAEEGDTEAMVMVAEGMRYGFVDEDDSEPYIFWLTKAAESGDKDAMALIEELDISDGLWEVPSGTAFVTHEARSGMDATDMLLLDDRPHLEAVGTVEDETLILERRVLLDAPDFAVREECGIEEYFRQQEQARQLLDGRDDQIVD